jgi:hypothetical protein
MPRQQNPRQPCLPGFALESLDLSEGPRFVAWLAILDLVYSIPLPNSGPQREV